MGIDLTILGLVLFFGLLGAASGAAKQVANAAGLALGYFTSRQLASVLGPKVATAMGVPLLAGTLTATVLVFVCVWLAVRYALGALILRFLSGNRPDERGADRALGFALGGAKVTAIIWVALSALTFFEQHVVVAGKHLGVAPKDSLSFQLARRFNLFELTQFAPLADLVRVAQASTDPQRAAKLQDDPAFKALRKDPRFQRALQDKELRDALARGDTRALLRNDLILQLIQDPDIAARLGAAARASQRH
ncbi:CvpA family protein [Corallococcus sp. H22C18031201]|uniref:CvpA family protein n=1 Tax=Citreicoccus inhibens TaxID=2849499 RepID=UPI000E72CC5F|nr:CvpA family protein [Citreicoccus inhibens]MBU8900528.1 CvpA family protein [Citreicoccus inhibens]RJS26895.1 CvpA family protein [Corallococcus sp. H22C18031201]